MLQYTSIRIFICLDNNILGLEVSTFFKDICKCILTLII